MFDKLESVQKKYERIQQQLERPDIAQNQNEYRELMKEVSQLQGVVETFQKYKKIVSEIRGNKQILEEENDPDLRSMAKEDLQSLEVQQTQIEEELRILLLPKDPNDDKNIFLEIRAGAGGDEASLFTEQLFRAYQYYAQAHGWKVSIDSLSAGNQGGYKEVIANISGDRVYSYLKYESGVHRVQRVPATEAAGRVHTSTITVAIIPEVDEVHIKVNQNDLRVDVMRSSGAGGQHVNTTDSAVRLTHLPTGLVVYCQEGKSQIANRDRAMKILLSRLQALEEEKQRKEASDSRLAQIGTGDRSERIRTYNFPQSRITDHRIGLTIHSINEVMSGEFSPLIDALITHYQAEALKKQEAQA